MQNDHQSFLEKANSIRQITVTVGDLKTLTGIEISGVILGTGSYGFVTEGLYDGLKVAVKVCNRSFLTYLFQRLHTDYESQFAKLWKEEQEISCKLSHPNIIRAYGITKIDNSIGLVFERAEIDLKKFIQAYLLVNNSFPLYVVLRILTDISLGFNYLSKCGLMHRDVSLGNFLFVDPCTVKLCDLGLCAQVSDPERSLEAGVGTPSYRAPEVDTGFYSLSCDVYSFGILVSSFTNGISLYAEPSPISEYLKDLDEEDSDYFTDKLRSYLSPHREKQILHAHNATRTNVAQQFPQLLGLVTACTYVNPERRVITFEDIVTQLLQELRNATVVELPTASSLVKILKQETK